MMHLPHGLHPSIDGALYHVRELGMVSKGALDAVHRSPLHYKAWIDGAVKDETTPTLIFGQAFHAALLEPVIFDMHFAVEEEFGDCRFKENKARRDNWRAAIGKRTVVSADDKARIDGMVAAVMAHPLAGRMIRDGEPELTARWKDEETGLECKARADYFVEHHGMIVDLKSTDDASQEAFARSVAKYGYARQAAFYRAAFDALKVPAHHFVFVAVEKSPPYAVAIYSLDDDALGRGHVSIRRNMIALADGVRTGQWPGYPTSIQSLSLPPWAA